MYQLSILSPEFHCHRNSMPCPLKYAWTLSKVWTDATLHIVEFELVQGRSHFKNLIGNMKYGDS